MKYCIVILLLLWQVCIGQSFTTRVSQKVIGREDVLQVEYVADNVDMDQFNLPRFANWTMVSGPDLSSSKILSGNTVSQQTIYAVMLKPRVGGVLVVPGATALINNKPQRSNQVSVQVKNTSHIGGTSPATAQPQPSLLDLLPDQLPANQSLRAGEDAVEKIKRNMFVRLEVSKQNCFVGEPIIATYKLCTRLKSRSKVVKQPAFNGCTVVELTSSYQNQHIEKIDGEEYNVFIIRKVQLTPLDSGKLMLPTAEVENDVSFRTASGSSSTDVFGNRIGPTENHVVKLQNKSLAIIVKSLPPYVGNGILSGAIGDFTITIQPGEEEFTTNGTNHLHLIIQGAGNLKPVKVPVMNWPKGIESFEATETEEIDRDANPVINRKIFTIPFSADKMGNYILPQVLFTYFDPNAKTYVNKVTPSFLLKVVPGSNNIIKKSAQFINDDDFDQRLYIFIGVGLLAIVLGVAWYSGTRRAKLPPEIITPVKEVVPPVTNNEMLSTAYLYNILQLEPGENTSFFYKNLNRNLGEYLNQRFKIKPSEIIEYANKHLTQSVLLLKMDELIKQCTLGMYTPAFNQEEAMQHRLQAIELLENLDRTL